MLGFSLKYIDSEKMVLDDWLADYEVFEYAHAWEEQDDSENISFS